MKLIEVTPEDKEWIKKIYKNEIESFGVMGGADMWLIKSFIRYGKLYILVKNEKLLSVAQFQKVFQEESVFLYGFSTVEEERNKGYGKELLKKVHEKLKKEKIEKIYLTVDPKNQIAVDMYKKVGYEIIEFEKDEYGEGIDRYLMTKKL